MKKILLFSFFLVIGLVVSQFLPAMVGENYSMVKTISNTLLYVCLAFIMINVGREFEMDKTRWKSYTEDYFIAMGNRSLSLDLCGVVLYVRPASRYLLVEWRSHGGKPVAEPFAGAYLCRASLYYACCGHD